MYYINNYIHKCSHIHSYCFAIKQINAAAVDVHYNTAIIQ